MSTKSDLTTLINSNLADESEIQAAKHRAVENEIADNLFPDLIHDNQNASTVLLSLIPGLVFGATVTKHGNLVVINCSFITNTLLTANTNIFQFKISEYNVPSFRLSYGSAVTYSTTSRTPNTIVAEGNKIKCLQTIQANTQTFFNLTYAVAP